MISTFIHIHSHELIQIIFIHIRVHEFIKYNYTEYRDSLPSYTMPNASQDLLQIMLIHFNWFHEKTSMSGPLTFFKVRGEGF